MTKKPKLNEADAIVASLRKDSKTTTTITPKETEKSVVLSEKLEETEKPAKRIPIRQSDETISFEEQLLIKDKRMKYFQSFTDSALYNVYLSGGGKFIETPSNKALTLKVFRGSTVKFGQLFGKLILGNVTFFMIQHDHKDSDTSEILFEPQDIIKSYNSALKNTNV